jgi:hypothetical protein
VTTTIDITALSMIAWPAPMPSSPAPAARPDRASGLDRSARPSKVADRADDAEVSIDQNGIQPSQKSLTQNFGHSRLAAYRRGELATKDLADIVAKYRP